MWVLKGLFENIFQEKKAKKSEKKRFSSTRHARLIRNELYSLSNLGYAYNSLDLRMQF